MRLSSWFIIPNRCYQSNTFLSRNYSVLIHVVWYSSQFKDASNRSKRKIRQIIETKVTSFPKTYHILLILGATRTICIDRTCYMMWCNAECGFVVIDVNQRELRGTISKAINCLKCETLTSEYEWQRWSCCEFSTFVFHVLVTCQKRKGHQKFIHHVVFNIHQQQSYAANRSKVILCWSLFTSDVFQAVLYILVCFFPRKLGLACLKCSPTSFEGWLEATFLIY